MIIPTLLVTVLVTIAGTWSIAPVYTASATLRIATAAASSYSYNDYMFADRLITTYINIATSRPFMEELTKQLDLSNLPSINVQQIPNSELIQITVESRDPNLAMEAANSLGNILILQGGEYYSGSGRSPADVMKVEVDAAEAKLDQLRATYYDRLTNYPDDVSGIQDASKAVDLQQELYFSLSTQYQTLRAREAIQSNIISFVETAVLPTSPTKPNKGLNIGLGFVVGLIGGIGLAFIFESLDTTLHSSAEIGEVLSLHPIGRIPFISKKIQRIPLLNGNSPFGEAISRLRTNLISLTENPPQRSFLIASSLQGEGKTMLATNLAYALAQSGKRVVLIDCDFRIPSVHKVFNLKNSVGLSNYLLDKANLDRIIKGTKYAGLNVITSGKVTNKPTLLLDSSKMKALIPILLNDYDTVILDSPALLPVTDASVLAPLVDGVLMVTRLRRIQKEKLEAAIEQLNNVKANMIGLIINGDASANRYSYYSRRTTPLNGR